MKGPDEFNLFRRRAFGADPNATPDFGQAPGNIAPAGFVDHVENKTTNVRIDETGIHVTNGEITVTNPGSTVIIDGTSNMFKIIASGTLSAAAAANAADTGTGHADLPGLGTLSETPGLLGFIGDSSASSATRSPAAWFAVKPNVYVALSSGGAVTHQTMTMQTIGTCFSSLVSGTATVDLSVFNYGNPLSITLYLRYFVLREAAI